MTLLQVQSFGVFETLTQYGALGVITLGLGAALWFLLKRQIASEDKLKSQVDALQKEMNDYIRNDQNQVRQAIDNNTKALADLRDTIIRGKK
jgi:3-mercaptopyruvate sulfurtransferase SseA